MLNNKLSLNTVMFILVIIAGIEVIGLFCSSAPPPQQNNQNKAQAENYTTGPPTFHSFFMPLLLNTKQGLHFVADWIDTNSDTVIALATIAIALFTWTLWQTSREHSQHMADSIALAEKNMIIGQRAFVFAKEFSAIRVNLIDIQGSQDNWRVSAVLENTGGTPTKKLMMNINWDSFKQEIQGDFDFPDSSQKPVHAFIGPRSNIHSTHIDIPNALFEGSLLEEENRIYVWGWVDYNDVFDGTPRHRTEFCYEIVFQRVLDEDGVVNQIRSFRAHGKYNGADDECYRKPSPYVPPT